MIHFVLVSVAYPRVVAKEITQRSGNWISSHPEVDTVRGKGTYWAGSESQAHVPGQGSRLGRRARHVPGQDSRLCRRARHVPGQDSRRPGRESSSRDLNFGTGMRFSPSPKHSPPRLLLNGYGGALGGSSHGCIRLTTNLHLLPRLSATFHTDPGAHSASYTIGTHAWG